MPTLVFVLSLVFTSFNFAMDIHSHPLPWQSCHAPQEPINAGKINCSTSLKAWITAIQDPNLLKHTFQTEANEFNVVDIVIDMFKNRPKFNLLRFSIESMSGDILLQGTMKNGRIKELIKSTMRNHPSWKSKILIAFDELDRNTTFVTGFITNGKLNGLVQVYGRFTIDPQGHCSGVTFPGLSFIGMYKDGKPNGPCWRFLIGGSFIYGIVDDQGQFTGNKTAFIYPDLEVALVGQFKNGIMINSRAIDVIGSSCDENGIKMLEFSQFKTSPVFHYKEATNETFGDQPLVLDALDEKYAYVKKSVTFENANQGAFAARDIDANVTIALFGGMLFNPNQAQIHNKLNVKKAFEIAKDPENAQLILDDLLMYRSNLKQCGLTIDVPNPNDYNATLGHKINHDFERPNVKFFPLETARFGVIWAVKTLMSINKDDELLANYDYPKPWPRWYTNLYKAEKSIN